MSEHLPLTEADLTLGAVGLTFGLPGCLVANIVLIKQLLELAARCFVCPNCDRNTDAWSFCARPSCRRRYLYCGRCVARGHFPPEAARSTFYQCRGPCGRSVCRSCFRGARSGCAIVFGDGGHHIRECPRLQKCIDCAEGITRCGACDRDACDAHAGFCPMPDCDVRICDLHTLIWTACRAHLLEYQALAPQHQTGTRKRDRATRDQ